MFDSIDELTEARGYKDKRSISWNKISGEENLSEKFIRNNQSLVNWHLVSKHQMLSEDFIREFSGRLFWHEIIQHQKVTESFIEEFATADKWEPSAELLSRRQQKTLEKEGRPFEEVEYWRLVSMKNELANAKGLSPAFMEKHQNRLSWPVLSRHQHLPMPLIDRHQQEVDWIAITRSQVLSERFIEKHRDKVEWETISFHQDLSERFIDRHHAKMSFISAEQKRSEPFLYTHLEKMDAASIIENQDLRTVHKYKPMDVYVIEKNGRRKYIVQFHDDTNDQLWNIQKTDDEELYEYLEENGLHEVIPSDFPELLLKDDYEF